MTRGKAVKVRVHRDTRQRARSNIVEGVFKEIRESSVYTIKGFSMIRISIKIAIKKKDWLV